MWRPRRVFPGPLGRGREAGNRGRARSPLLCMHNKAMQHSAYPSNTTTCRPQRTGAEAFRQPLRSLSDRGYARSGIWTSENAPSRHLVNKGKIKGRIPSVPGKVVQEGGLPYEIEALETGWRLGLHASDWENLLGLADRYGWRPSAGLDHYLSGGRHVVPPSDARALARVLEGVLKDLPPERRKEVRPDGALGGFVNEVPRPGPDADYQRYFARQRRWIVEEFVRFCRQGAVEIRPM